MPDTPTVSVILPVYNRLSTLYESAKSVLDQSWDDLELIVVDDASTEDLTPVIARLSDPRLRYIRQERNTGAAGARNTGLAAATGAFIAFQDSDDLWLPGKLERQISALRDLPDNVGGVTSPRILHGIDEIQRTGPGRMKFEPPAGEWLTLEEDQIANILNGNRISPQTSLFRRDCYPLPEWFDPYAKANNDWEFAVRLLQHTKILEDPLPVVMSYVSTDSISRQSRKKITGQIRILKKNQNVFSAYPKAHGHHLFTLGRALEKIGKKRTGRRFTWAGLKLAPLGLTFRIARSTLHRIRSLVTAR